jgi:hypothetical protein
MKSAQGAQVVDVMISAERQRPNVIGGRRQTPAARDRAHTAGIDQHLPTVAPVDGPTVRITHRGLVAEPGR